MLLYKALKLCLHKITYRGLTIEERKFIVTYLVIAYFRIPEFRSKLLECLTDESEIQIDEWKSIHFSLDETEIDGSAMLTLFDWEKEFYEKIPEVILSIS